MAPPVKELPPRQRAPSAQSAPPSATAFAEDGAQLQVRVSELEPAVNISDSDQLEVSQGGVSRKMSVLQMKATTLPDLTPFLTGIVGGEGIEVLGSAPVPTVQLAPHGAAGTFGDADHVPQITVDEHGRVSGVMLVPVAQPDVTGFAPIESPAFTGVPTAPSPAPGSNSDRIATTQFVGAEIGARGFAPLASPTFTGDPRAPTPMPGDNDTTIATTAFVEARVAGITPVDLTPYALKDSPTFIGTPKAPTPATIDSTTNIATTEFVKAQGYVQADSPALTGTPTAPTPAVGANNTLIATTAFVTEALAGGGASISVGVTPPASPAANALWWHSEKGQLFIYYSDGSSLQWVPATPAASMASPGGDFMATNSANIVVGAASIPLILNSVATGNAGGHYNATTGRYTPPPGRYLIHATVGEGGYASQQCITEIVLFKNGVQIARGGNIPGNANWFADSAVEVLIDANGTDYFDVTTSANVAGAAILAGCAKFLAFPVSGVKGPPGDIGAPVANFNVRATTTDTLSGPANMALFRAGALSNPVKDHDPDNVWNLAANLFTAPSTGRYAFSVFTYLAVSTAGQAAVVIRHMTAANVLIREYEDGHNVDGTSYGANFSVSAEFQMSAGERVLFLVGGTAATTNILAVAGNIGGLAGGVLTYAYGRKVV
jgi:hypothetical protein